MRQLNDTERFKENSNRFSSNSSISDISPGISLIVSVILNVPE